MEVRRIFIIMVSFCEIPASAVSIVFLKGTSCAGKTSVGASVANLSPAIHHICEDEFILRTFV